MAIFELENEHRLDEITQYQMGRYISSNEAVWRILGFHIHDRYPAVVHLSVHLENGQRVYFNQENVAARSMNPPNTTLTGFFQLCQTDPFARTLLYHQVPQFYTWSQNKTFCRRKQGVPVEGFDIKKSDTIGRVYTVHPNNAECFYLRILLYKVVRPTSFAAIRTIDDHVCETFREACQKLGLLEDDQHWDNTLSEAVVSSLPSQLRHLFSIILTCCNPSNPKELWSKYKESLSEDILREAQRANEGLAVTYSPIIFNETLIRIDDICILMNNKSISQLGLDSPDRSNRNALDRDILREQNYDMEQLEQYVNLNKPLLTDEQKIIYDGIMEKISNSSGGIFFIDAPGGTGKTFIINLILAEIRKDKGIALAVASSGIASTLLHGGRTVHSTFQLPLDLATTENPVCRISKTSSQGKLLKECKVIFWDECTMSHKKALEAINNTMKDLKGNDSVMGGAVVVLSGDFRQILPVIKRSTPAAELDACLKQSPLWKHVKVFSLRTNMRVHLQGDSSAKQFSDQLLQLGNGDFPTQRGTNLISFPPEFCNIVTSVEELIVKVFPNIDINFRNAKWISERVILAPKNDNVESLNIKIQDQVNGEQKQYTSIDCVMEEEQAVRYPTEFLNSLNPNGMPPHILKLKIGSPIILLRNLSPPKLCNGTRMGIKRMMPNLIEATILSGHFEGIQMY